MRMFKKNNIFNNKPSRNDWGISIEKHRSDMDTLANLPYAIGSDAVTKRSRKVEQVLGRGLSKNVRSIGTAATDEYFNKLVSAQYPLSPIGDYGVSVINPVEEVDAQATEFNESLFRESRAN